MDTIETLDIRGFHDQAVPNTFFRQAQDTNHLAILLPGNRYSCDMPLLYYPTLYLRGQGADVLHVDYAYYNQPEFSALPPAGQGAWFFGDVSAACQVALSQRAYTRLTLIGKSMGTLAMGQLLSSDPRFAQAHAVWLTPLLGNGRLMGQIRQIRTASLFIIGNADHYFDAALLKEAENTTGGESLVILGANHSLEIQSDFWGSLGALEQVLQKIGTFLGE